ncbi:MAG: HIT domain-containing protein [Bacilli bacterium]|nr:HIT domain-containing protein [Bacilli bacterium]
MDCLFCKIINGEIPCKKIYEDDKVIAILDLHPSSDGHTLIIPKKHVTDLMEIDDETLSYVNTILKKLTPILMNKMNATAFSLRVNYGTSQEIKHYHMHLLPNYQVKKTTLTQEQSYEILKDSIK